MAAKYAVGMYRLVSRCSKDKKVNCAKVENEITFQEKFGIQKQIVTFFFSTYCCYKCMMYIRVVRDALGACSASKMLMRR